MAEIITVDIPLPSGAVDVDPAADTITLDLKPGVITLEGVAGVGPVGPVGPQGVQGIQGIQGDPGQDAVGARGLWTPRLIASATYTFVDIGTGPNAISFGRWVREGALVHLWFTMVLGANCDLRGGAFYLVGSPDMPAGVSMDVQQCVGTAQAYDYSKDENRTMNLFTSNAVIGFDLADLGLPSETVPMFYGYTEGVNGPSYAWGVAAPVDLEGEGDYPVSGYLTYEAAP